MMIEADFDPKMFAKRLEQLIRNPGLLREAATRASELSRTDAADKMADIVIDVIKGNKK